MVFIFDIFLIYNKVLVEIWYFCKIGIFPEVLQVIELSDFWLEDVDENVYEVDGNPLVVS